MEEETYRVKEEHRITQMILKNAPVGIVHVGNDYSIREVNAAIAEHFGLAINDLLHKNIFEALPWLPKEPFRNALEDGERYFEREFSVGDPHEDSESSAGAKSNGDNSKNDSRDGIGPGGEVDSQSADSTASASDSRNNFAQKSGHFDIAIWPVESENHTIIGAVLIAVDVAERVRLAQQREDFVATLTHDLQTPVIATDRAIELLLNSAGKHLEESHLMLVKKLRANNSNLLHMIQQLLDVYRYEAGAQVHYFDTVNLGLTVESCVDSVSAIIKDHDLTVETDLPTNLKKIWADHPAVRRVLINLLENAIKYTPRHSKITIGARNLPTCVLLSISNPGSGIQQEDIPLLFQRYWHKSQEKTYKPSSGLGLYLCKQIVEAHGGEIWCESEQNQMTTFYVKLPFLKLEGKDKRHIKGKVASAN
ncbi:MAG: GHKL domain-containing protein [Leptolyngbya sp.]|nr:GHKL domain-containing protein [Candidatus Melainabacteria bacterium]